MSRFPLSFIGLRHAGAADELVQKGKRRVVTYLAFIMFVLLVASATDEEWVTGGLEYTFTSLSEWKAAAATGACGDVPYGVNMEAKTSLGITIQREFDLGLDKVTEKTSYQYYYSNGQAERDCTYDLTSYVDNINAAAASNDSSPRNIWYGLAPIKTSVFSATLGLIGFSAFLQIVIWLAMAAVQYSSPYLSESKTTLWVVRGCAIGVAFFTLVAILVFGTSAVKSEFCKAFDPDAAFTGMSCGFGNGFNIAIAALVFAIIQVVATWFYMTLDLPSAYSFSGKPAAASSYEPSSTGTGAASFQSTTTSGLTSSAYNTIGSDNT